jgi:antitoxin CptB
LNICEREGLTFATPNAISTPPGTSGLFADAEIATLSDDELAQLEHLIEVPDPDLYAALTGNVALSPEYASDLFDRIKSFRVADHDA